MIRERLEEYVLSRLGQNRLSNIRPSSNMDWVQAEIERVSELQDAFRFDDPVPLDHFLDIRDAIRRIAPEEAFIGPEDLLAVRLVLVTLRRLRNYFESRARKYVRLSEAVSRIIPLSDVETRIQRIIDDEGRIRDDASPELHRLRRLIIQRQHQLRETLQQELRRAVGQGFATEDQPTLRNGRMVIPVRSEARRKVQGFVQDVSATGQTVYIEPAACLDLNNEVRELSSEEQREIERILRQVAAYMRTHIDALQENVRALSFFDLLQAKARLSNELGAVVPQLNENGIIDIREGRNPVLLLRFNRLRQETGQDRNVVPLNLSLGEDFHTLIITGPNAGGKTVAMKTVGLFALMLAYGLPIPVDATSRFSTFQWLMVDIGDQQSLEEDLSTFSSHVSNLKRMMSQGAKSTLILIDEAGTGTDPTEGGALAQAVLEQLTERNARTIATTHHGTLKAFAHETEGVENGSMQFDQETLSPTYRFQMRVPGSSYAFDIAQRIGLPEHILERARTLAGHQKTMLEDLIATFEKRNQQLEERLREAEQNARRASEERNRFEERNQVLREERDKIRQDALREAEQILQNANAAVERTIRQIREAQAEKEATRTARAELENVRAEIERRKKKAERRKRSSKRTDARHPDARSESSSKGPIRVGDQVVLDGGTTVAEVLETEDEYASIAFGSMRMRVALNRLQKVGGPRKQVVTVRQVHTGDGGISATQARTSIDLRGRRVDEALQEVTQLIDEAIAHNLERVEILHGIGTGALRQSIHDYLGGNPDVKSFEDAPWNQGGAGVTYVFLR